VIRFALSSFAPFNLSAIVYSLVNSVFDKIEKTEWYLALVAASRSAQFVRFLLPFEHRLLELEDYREYVDRIGRLELPLLTVSRSRQRLVGMTCVSCVKQNTVLNLEQFIVPLKTEFEESEFLEQVIGPIDLERPSETFSAVFSPAIPGLSVARPIDVRLKSLVNVHRLRR
jgi:hypothetical protein